MKIKKTDSNRAFQTSCFKPGESMVRYVGTFRHLAQTSLLCAALVASNMASAQDTIAMVDHSAASVSGSQLTPVAVSAVQGLEADAVAPVKSHKEQDGKSPITGLEPGTLALIGFGLLALAATRRNAR